MIPDTYRTVSGNETRTEVSGLPAAQCAEDTGSEPDPIKTLPLYGRTPLTVFWTALAVATREK
jgi:hypothetical protein